jgi:hypothetical protein
MKSRRPSQGLGRIKERLYVCYSPAFSCAGAYACVKECFVQLRILDGDACQPSSVKTVEDFLDVILFVDVMLFFLSNSYCQSCTVQV